MKLLYLKMMVSSVHWPRSKGEKGVTEQISCTVPMCGDGLLCLNQNLEWSVSLRREFKRIHFAKLCCWKQVKAVNHSISLPG